jgi:hypothetical protein
MHYAVYIYTFSPSQHVKNDGVLLLSDLLQRCKKKKCSDDVAFLKIIFQDIR